MEENLSRPATLSSDFPLSDCPVPPCKTITMPRFIHLYYRLWPAVIVFAGCAMGNSNKIYQAPRMGAEYRFEEGLRPEKRPQYLFDKKTMKDMEKQNIVGGYAPKRRNTAPTIPIPKKVVDSVGAVKDSSSAAVRDSLAPVQDSSTAPVKDLQR